MYSQGMEVFGLSYGRLSHIISTCNAFPNFAVRSKNLPFGVYEAVAPLMRSGPEGAERAEKLLAEAEAGEMTVEGVKDALRPDVEPPEMCVCQCGNRHRKKG